MDLRLTDEPAWQDIEPGAYRCFCGAVATHICLIDQDGNRINTVGCDAHGNPDRLAGAST